ncbi:MAG: hypothetical protein HY243_06205 [Proteobacteria bacterium]|nr:hypothetical protein [Pseudomonadota bacterium]
MQFVKCIAAAAVTAVLAGCAAQPEIPFDKSANTNVHTIGIVTPGMPERPTIWLASDMGQSFGLIGALVDAGMEESRDSKVNAMLVNRKFVPRDSFVQALESSLKAQGFDTKAVAVERKQGDYLKSYPATADTGADAYLDISAVNYGYVAAGIGSSTPYRPFVYLLCRLVRASDGSVLMQDSIFYNPVAPFGQGKNVSVSPDPAYTFVNFDAMTVEPDRTVTGIDLSLHQTSDALGRLLR